MTKVGKLNCINSIGTFDSEDVLRGKTNVRCRPSQTFIQQLHYLESKFVDFRICSVKLETLRGKLWRCWNKGQKKSIEHKRLDLE